jgi:hypothetical protein
MEGQFSSLLNQFTVAVILTGATFFAGLVPLLPIAAIDLSVNAAAIIPLLFLAFIAGIVFYILADTIEIFAQDRGLVVDHFEIFEQTIRDEDVLSEELTLVFFDTLAEEYDVTEAEVKSNLDDFYRLVLSGTLQSQWGMARTLLGFYLFSRNAVVIFPALLPIYFLFPTQYPIEYLVVLLVGLTGVFAIGYYQFKRIYIGYLITDYASIRLNK